MSGYKSYRSDALDALRNQAEADQFKALASLKILLNHPAGIGDHSTSDLHNNLNSALSLLADAEGRLDTLRKFYKEICGG